MTASRFPLKIRLQLLSEECDALLCLAEDMPALRWLREIIGQPITRRYEVTVPDAAWAQTVVDALDYVARTVPPGTHTARGAAYAVAAFRHNVAYRGHVFLKHNHRPERISPA